MINTGKSNLFHDIALILLGTILGMLSQHISDWWSAPTPKLEFKIISFAFLRDYCTDSIKIRNSGDGKAESIACSASVFPGTSVEFEQKSDGKISSHHAGLLEMHEIKLPFLAPGEDFWLRIETPNRAIYSMKKPIKISRHNIAPEEVPIIECTMANGNKRKFDLSSIKNCWDFDFKEEPGKSLFEFMTESRNNPFILSRMKERSNARVRSN